MFDSYRRSLVVLLVAVSALAACTLAAQEPGGNVERIRVPGPSLEGNLTGDDATRDVFVYLPPSYSRETRRRYPVVIFLHGYTATAETYVSYVDLPTAADNAIAAGAREMMVVFPDAFTAYSGSMYSSSATTGDWATYIAGDLIDYVDRHYRTLAQRESRGLSGHSMGGYGTVRNGMKRPDVFGALYALSSCCLLIDPASGGDVVMRLRAIALDVGNADPLRADNVNLDAALTRLRVTHEFEEYEGDHGNRVRERFASKVLPLFSQQFDAARR